MAREVVSLLFLQWLLVVEVQCQQTFPYVLFMGQTLANHSYVDITQVGTGSAAVYCRTDLTTCCSGGQGVHRGDWYFPNGDRLPFPDVSPPIFESRQAQRVELRRINNTNEPTGIYRCDIPTDAVNHATDISVRASVYVGLYPSDGGELLCGVMLLSMIMRLFMWDFTPLIEVNNYLMHHCIAVG